MDLVSKAERGEGALTLWSRTFLRASTYALETLLSVFYNSRAPIRDFRQHAHDRTSFVSVKEDRSFILCCIMFSHQQQEQQKVENVECQWHQVPSAELQQRQETISHGVR